MDNDAMIQALRRRSELQSEANKARSQANAFAGAFPRPQFSTQSQGYSGNIGGSSFQVPGQVSVNWGDIIGKGASNFLSARASKKASEAEAEEDSISQEFMMSTLGSDEQAMKLYSLAQAGMPGASEALAKHIAPKKEALAGLVQGISSGMVSPEMLKELAPRYGVDPAVAERAGAYATQQAEMKEQRKSQTKRDDMLFKFGLQKQLKGIPQARAPGSGRKSREITTSTGQVFEVDGEPVHSYDLTPGQKQIQAKQIADADATIKSLESQVAKFPDVWAEISKPGALGPQQAVVQSLMDSGIPFVQDLARRAQSPGSMAMADFVNAKVLENMKALGGNDSNEELKRMMKVVPDSISNPDTARHMLKRFDAWNKANLEFANKVQQDRQTGMTFAPNYKKPSWKDIYRKYSSGVTENYQPQDTGSLPVSPDMRPKTRKSFDDIFNEVNQ